MKNKTADSDSSLTSEEEQNVVPPLAKRKRSSEASRAQGLSAAQTPSIPSINVSPPNIAQVSGLAPISALMSGYSPSPDEDDHITIKKLKTQHLQSSDLHALASLFLAPTPIQLSRSVQSTIPVQPAISTPSLATIVELEDSDEEQGLRGFRTNILIKYLHQSKL